jgi:hypothetical protein
MKKIFDKKAKPKNFVKREIVILWDKRHENPRRHRKFDNLWLGPLPLNKSMPKIPILSF